MAAQQQRQVRARQTFPSKLYDILSNPASSGIIEWTADGGGFVVLDRVRLNDILARYNMSPAFRTFQRQLNLYGFVTTSGTTRQRFFHRDTPRLDLVTRVQNNAPLRNVSNIGGANISAATAGPARRAGTNSPAPPSNSSSAGGAHHASQTTAVRIAPAGPSNDVQQQPRAEAKVNREPSSERNSTTDTDQQLKESESDVKSEEEAAIMARYLPFDIKSIPTSNLPLTREEIDAWNNRLQYNYDDDDDDDRFSS